MTNRAIEPYNTRAILSTYLKTPYNRLFVGNLDGQDYLISDGFTMMRLPSNHPAFDSRSTFPAFPAVGIGREYRDNYTGKDIEGLPRAWEACLAYIKGAEMTNWVNVNYSGGSQSARVLRSNGVPIFVQERYIQLIDPTLHTFRCDKPTDAVAAWEGDAMRLIIMPMHFGEDQKKSFAWVDGLGKG